MDAELENVKKEIAQLAETVKAHANDQATIDEDRLTKAITDIVNKQFAAKVAEEERKRPIRKGEIIGPPGFETVSKGIVQDGKFAGQRIDDVLFTHSVLRRASQIEGGGIVKPPSKDLTDVVQKALDATTASSGDEYVPTNMAASLWGDMFLSSRVISQFATVPMPTDPFDMPLGWGQLTWRKGTANTATTATNPATAKSTLTSTEQIAEVDWAYDLDEDGVIAILPTLRADISRDAAEQMDKFLMNADATDAATGNINLDDADPAATMYYLTKGQDGLRHQVIVDYTAQSTDINTTLTDALLMAGIGRLDKYAIDVPRLVLFCNPKTYYSSLLKLTNVQTVDKYGPAATVLTGELMRYSGIPVIPTASIALAEDDGKVSDTANNNDEGTIIIAHRDMWRVGFRRSLLFELYRDIQKRQLVLVISFRMAVAAQGTRASAKHTAGVHGITY